MKKTIYILLLLLFILYSCKSEFNQNTNGEIIKNKHSTGFEISKIEEGYILKVFNKFNNQETTTHNYLLSSKSNSESGNNEIINIPVTKVVCLSTTHCAFISQLNKSNTIKGISGLNYIYNDEIRSMIRNSQISEIGFDTQLNIEKIISLNPDVVFAYGIDNNGMSIFQKLDEIGIPIVYIGEFLETSPLGRTEWIKFFACFYDNFDYACEYFDSIESNYNLIKSKIDKNKSHSPEILTNLPWQGTWWVPGANSYFANFIKDAGGTYNIVNTKTKESVPLTIEEVFEKSKNAEIWLNPNQITRKKEIIEADSRLKNFKPLNNCIIYNNNKRTNIFGGNDYFESGILHPDIILQDLGIIFHDIETKDKLHYYQAIN